MTLSSSTNSCINFGFVLIAVYILIKLHSFIRRRQWQATPVLLPGKSHGQKSLAGYRLCGCRELDTTVQLSWRRQWHPTPVLLPGKSQGRRSMVGCSSWGREELDTTERLHFHFSLSCIGEGNGNPLQYSCLENPKDGGAW